ncbi:hypothetical protein FQR65_LT06594 [Abscondita terminalis]|nr:hypothetical protein FQR65_LT06594 [Abscondita terminalis]
MCSIIIKLFLLFVVLIHVNTNDLENGPEVTVDQGKIKGKFWFSRQGKKFSAFLSIPYAEPPIGDLRFKAPVPGKAWSGTLDGTRDHVVCPQRNIYTRSEIIEGDENCLFLNVYTPQISKSNKPNYAVMVFLHGGGWLCGGGNSKWYGPDMLLDKDVVLVVPNYRLGALGFLSTGDEILPGNNGMKDQSLALKWIKKNIIQFGGDPNKITIFGESAGGASAHFHMLSPLSKGLFHAAISQSGTAHAPWGLAKPEENVKQAHKLAKSFNCPTTSSQRMLDCLKKIDTFDLIAKDKIFMEWDTDPMIPFKPVIEPDLDGAFLIEHPSETIKSGRAAQVPWMTGITTEDGVLRAAAIFGNQHLMHELDEDFNKILPVSLFYKGTCSDQNYVSNKLREFYLGSKKIDNNTRFNVIDLYTDGWFLNGADESVQLHFRHTTEPVYYYLFGHRGVASFSQLFGDPHQRYGVCHADDLQYMFPVGDSLFPDQKQDVLDQRITEIITTLWTNFAKYRNPTPVVDYMLHSKWEPVQSEKFEYYYIGGGVHLANGLLWERTKFWRNLAIRWHTKCVKDEL